MPGVRRVNRGPSAAAENRAALIAAAREVFASDGYEAPLTSITRVARVGQGSLYRHFPDRISLALAVFEDGVRELEALAAEPGATLDAMLALMTEQMIASTAFVDMVSVSPPTRASCASATTWRGCWTACSPRPGGPAGSGRTSPRAT
nr:hypothetical protein GCM10020093_016610 [Planobispora longispora]